MRPHLMHACARGPNPHVRHSCAAMFAKGLRHFTHCCAAGPKPHELQSCAGVSANGAPHAMHWDAFGPKPQVAQRWAVVDMGAGYEAGLDLTPALRAPWPARPMAAAPRSGAQTDPGTTKRKALGPSASE